MTNSIDNSNNTHVSSDVKTLKKKKKLSYKDMMKQAMTCERTDEDIDNAHKRCWNLLLEEDNLKNRQDLK